MYSFDLTPTCCWANKNPAVSRMSLSHDNDLKNTPIFVALCLVTKKREKEKKKQMKTTKIGYFQVAENISLIFGLLLPDFCLFFLSFMLIRNN